MHKCLWATPVHLYTSWGEGSWKITASAVASQIVREGELFIEASPQAVDSTEQTEFKVFYPYTGLFFLQFMGSHKKT